MATVTPMRAINPDRDGVRKALLLELMPIGIGLAFFLPWLVLLSIPGEQRDQRVLIAVLEAPFSPLIAIAGFGWMGREHAVIGSVILLVRAGSAALAGPFLWAAFYSPFNPSDATPFVWFVSLCCVWAIVPLASAVALVVFEVVRRRPLAPARIT